MVIVAFVPLPFENRIKLQVDESTNENPYAYGYMEGYTSGDGGRRFNRYDPDDVFNFIQINIKEYRGITYKSGTQEYGDYCAGFRDGYSDGYFGRPRKYFIKW